MTKSRKIILIILAILTVTASITKILIGLDYDENYITVLGTRLPQGDHLFRECWDLYQTTGLTMTLVLSIFKGITGSYEGAILFCRSITAVLQLLLGMFTWYSLKKYFRNADFAGLLVANLLPRGTMNLEYGFLSCNYILVSMILLFSVSKEWNNWGKLRIRLYLMGAGALFSMGILCYPTMILATLPLIAYFIRNKERKEQSLFFIGTCIVCAVIFCSYVFLYLSPVELWNNVIGGIVLDESHGNGNFINSFLGSFTLSKEKLLQVGTIAGTALGTYGIYYWINKEKLPYACHLMLVSSLAIIGLNLLNIRPCGVFGMQIRYVLIGVAGGVISYKIKNRELSYLFYAMGVFMFLGTLLGSNLGMAENGAFLYLSMLAVILGLGEVDYQKEITYKLTNISVILLIASLILMKGYIVRVSGTEPANILETREQIEFGPFKGLLIEPEEIVNYSIRKEDIDQYVTEDDIVLVLSQDPIYNIYGEYRFSSVTALTTPVYGQQWVTYYKDRNYVQPTVVLIDKQYLNLDTLLNQTSFGAYLTEEYDVDALQDGQGFWILRK